MDFIKFDTLVHKVGNRPDCLQKIAAVAIDDFVSLSNENQTQVFQEDIETFFEYCIYLSKRFPVTPETAKKYRAIYENADNSDNRRNNNDQ